MAVLKVGISGLSTRSRKASCLSFHSRMSALRAQRTLLRTRERTKHKGSISILDKTKADGVADVVRLVPVPGRRAQVPRHVEPGTAANHAPRALRRIFWLPSCAIGWRAVIIAMVTILHPLPYVSCCVVQAKGVGFERSNRRRLLTIPSATAASAVRHSL